MWTLTWWCFRVPSVAKNWTGMHAEQRNECASVLTSEVPRLRDERGISRSGEVGVGDVDGTLGVCAGAGPCPVVDESRSDGGAAMRSEADGAMSDELMLALALCRSTEYDGDPNEGRPVLGRGARSNGRLVQA